MDPFIIFIKKHTENCRDSLIILLRNVRSSVRIPLSFGLRNMNKMVGVLGLRALRFRSLGLWAQSFRTLTLRTLESRL